MRRRGGVGAGALIIVCCLGFACSSHVRPREASPAREREAAAPQTTAASGEAPTGEPSVSPETSSPTEHGTRGRDAVDTGCPRDVPIRERGRLVSDELDEVSGMAASRRHKDRFWVHNDSGDTARVFALDASGELLATVVLRGAEAVDYEDIALGPGPKDGVDYLFVGDLGDNFANRNKVQIYWFEEPDLAGGQRTLNVEPRRLDVRYEDGPQDAESLFVDPRGGDLYIVAKGPLLPFDGQVSVYKVERAALEEGQAVARPVARIPMGPATAADITPDGSAVAVRNYTNLRLWLRAPEQSVAEALSGAGCELPLADLGAQGEALTFGADGRGYYTVAEGKGQALYFHGL